MSLLEGEEIFFSKLLSRESSKGFSSRIYYRVAVPFQWEVQPGKPKVEPERELLPPLSLPPVMMALAVPHRPCNDTIDRGSTMSKLFFWKGKARKTRRSRSQSQNQSHVGSEDGGLSRANSFGFWSNEGDSTCSPCHSSSSSLSSSRSSFNGFSASPKLPALESKMMVKASNKSQRMEALNEAWRRSPWRFAAVMVCMAKGD
ncbi:hypothetical protein ACLOJK_036749 [Asimina triloba]